MEYSINKPCPVNEKREELNKKSCEREIQREIRREREKERDTEREREREISIQINYIKNNPITLS